MSAQKKQILLLFLNLLAVIEGPECGKRSSHIPGLVTGTQDAVLGEFPWHAGIYSLARGTYNPLCGATLIRTNLVVTAAHCVYDDETSSVRNATGLKVAFGKLHRDYNENSTNQGLQLVDVASIAVPPRYRGRRFNYIFDVAILKLASHVQITRTVNVACVELDEHPENDQFSAGDTGTVAGWGWNGDDASGRPKVLQKIILPWIDPDQCFNETDFDSQILLTYDKFCAGFADKSRSVCKGDSGGGYMKLENGRYYLRGVVSVHLSPVETTCSAEHYTAFTAISDHARWIKEQISKN